MTRIEASELEALARLARNKWGLVIDKRKQVIVENRLHSLRRTHRVEDIPSLVRTLELGQDPRLELALFDVLSTNHTHFFREEDHLNTLRSDILNPARANGRRLRLWSAGCSRGCEPYSLSILLHEIFDDPAKLDHRILATDLSTGALDAARRGVYTRQEMQDVSPQRRTRFFKNHGESEHSEYAIQERVRAPVSFHMLNLLDTWPMKGPFDAVFCRNVMIYFDSDTRKKLAERFLRLVRPGGFLFIGTSETLSGFDLDAEPLSVGAYRRAGAAA